MANPTPEDQGNPIKNWSSKKFKFADRGCWITETFVAPNRYELLHPIAKGAYGFVARAEDTLRVAEYNQKTPEEQKRKGTDPKEGSQTSEYDLLTRVAMKKFAGTFKKSSSRVWLCAIREIQLLFKLRHTNIISATDLFIKGGPIDFDDVYIVMPFMDYTLAELLDKHHTNGTPIEQRFRKHLLYHITCGLGYMHARGVMHRDLKPANILFSPSDSIPKICDFGQGRDIALHQSVFETQALNCTQWYAAPETLDLNPQKCGGNAHIHEQNFRSADAWSLGCIAAELLLGRPLFPSAVSGGQDQLSTILAILGPPRDEDDFASCRSDSDKSSFNDIISRTLTTDSRLEQLLRSDPIGEGVDEDEVQLIMGLVRYSTTKRLTCEVALESRYFLKSEYEPNIKENDSADMTRIQLVPKDEVDTKEKGRECLWKLFLEKHPTVPEPINAS